MIADIEKIMNIARLATDSEYILQLQRLKYIQENKEYMISFMGQFSAGKSCLINNLIGKKILPVHITETTALVTFVRYDENERAEVYYKDGHIETIDIDCSVNLWQGNGNTEFEDIESLIIYVNSDMLKTGLVIADTPGINTVINKHKELAAEILKSSDKIVYVMGKAVSEEDIRFISKIRAYGISVILVRTHMDQIKSVEEDVSETIFSEEGYLKPYTDDDIFFLSNEQDSPFFEETYKLREYITNTLGSNIQETIDYTIEERLLFIAGKLKKLLSEKAKLLKDRINNQSEEFIVKQNEINEVIDKLGQILKNNEERIKKQYNSDKNIADENLQVIVDGAEIKARNLLDTQEFGEDTEMYIQAVHGFLKDTYETMYETYINVFDRILGENKNKLCGELDKSCPQFEFGECIPEDTDSLSEKEEKIQEQLLALQVQKDVYEQEIEQIQAGKMQDLERMSILKENAAQAKARYEIIKKELEQYPEYETRYLVNQEGNNKNEEFMRNIGNMLDWITVFIPGGGWIKAGSQAMSAGSKVISKIPGTKKIVKSLNNSAKALNSSKKSLKAADNIDHIMDITNVVKNVSEADIPGQKRRGLSWPMSLS